MPWSGTDLKSAVIRIPKLSLIVEIDEEFTEIFKVKGKVQFLKRQWEDMWIELLVSQSKDSTLYKCLNEPTKDVKMGGNFFKGFYSFCKVNVVIF